MTIKAEQDEVIGRKGVSAVRRFYAWSGHRKPANNLSQERGVFIIPTTQAILVGEVCTHLSP
jgi:hypothetical protein